jgi:hypothetical protein
MSKMFQMHDLYSIILLKSRTFEYIREENRKSKVGRKKFGKNDECNVSCVKISTLSYAKSGQSTMMIHSAKRNRNDLTRHL